MEKKKEIKVTKKKTQMAKSREIRVPPNVKKCLEELKAAVKSMPEGDLKKRAQGATNYLSQTLKAERQPQKKIRFVEKIESDKLFGTHITEAKKVLEKILKK